ncbi:MAG: DNA gyrase subunit A, partial [archaeon]|nr:DNA gyrase subunit A [archaeon]
LIHTFWPALLKREGFLNQFITPIVKAKSGKQEKWFYNLPEYEQWKHQQREIGKLASWSVKYYKGLGTSTSAEGKDYFSNLDRHQRSFRWTEGDDALIQLVFAKSQADARKAWIDRFYSSDLFLDATTSYLTYRDFINRELILFSHADNVRSIPSVVDGLKPGQRKALFACFKRNLKQELKVAQLAGYISEHTGYHHGEVSLHSTIINMAQSFVGSNNLPLLYPGGQFGTRLQGGKDAASARYIFTKVFSFHFF